jgi:hypothetical protein
MISKTIAAVISTIILCLAFAPPAAHAGGGMGTGGNLTTCRVVLSGAPNQYQVAKIQDELLSSTTADTVKIGALSLLCDLPAVGTTLNPDSNSLNGGTGQPVTPSQVSRVSCYTVSGADPAKVPVTVQDAFTTTFDAAGTYGVVLGAIQFVCVPALYDATP